MRKLVAILLVYTLLSISLDSCTSYENGPAFSLRSPMTRIVGEWYLADLLVNDKHEQTLFDREASTVFILNNNGTYSYSMQMVRALNERSGMWSFGEDKTELILTEVDSLNGNNEHNYKITRLSSTEMWLVNGSDEYLGYDDLIERHFEKKQE
ncbi:MAG: lipocalin family protein [Bacteroidales bacterium]|nr:lipocalin family protein [Bacteroidales bacterium]